MPRETRGDCTTTTGYGQIAATPNGRDPQIAIKQALHPGTSTTARRDQILSLACSVPGNRLTGIRRNTHGERDCGRGALLCGGRLPCHFPVWSLRRCDIVWLSGETSVNVTPFRRAFGVAGSASCARTAGLSACQRWNRACLIGLERGHPHLTAPLVCFRTKSLCWRVASYPPPSCLREPNHLSPCAVQQHSSINGFVAAGTVVRGLEQVPTHAGGSTTSLLERL